MLMMLRDLPVPRLSKIYLLQRLESNKEPKGGQLRPAAGGVGHITATQAPGPDSLGQTSGALMQLSPKEQLELLAAANANQAEVPDWAFSSGHRVGRAACSPRKV